jgi:Flp pilus assembly pilin Flp
MLCTVRGRRVRPHALHGVRDERGATAVEYGLVLGLIVILIAAALPFIGQRLLAIFYLIPAI